MRFATGRLSRFGVEPGSGRAYGLAVLCVTIAALVRVLLGLIDNSILPLSTFYPAVMIAALLAGRQAGVLATAMGGLVGWWAFMPPYYSVAPLTPAQSISLISYGLASLLIVWGADHYRALVKRLENEEELRKLAVEELAHRLKNKIATIQAVIGTHLRDNPKIRDDLQSLLQALSATDDLILHSQGRGVILADIIETEVKPYDRLRISRSGPSVFLPPKLAMTMGLLIHELATNAAKYGALSTPQGRLAITWTVSDGRLTVQWQETDGPAVSSVNIEGFGTRLFARALNQFGGEIERRFEPTGVVCNLSVDLPKMLNDASPVAGGEDGPINVPDNNQSRTPEFKLEVAQALLGY